MNGGFLSDSVIVYTIQVKSDHAAQMLREVIAMMSMVCAGARAAIATIATISVTSHRSIQTKLEVIT
jgi:hypothetical protein